MFKIIVSSFSLLVVTGVLAGDYQCQVSKKVVYDYECTQCAQRNADNDCIKEIQTTCIGSKNVIVASLKKEVVANQIYLGEKNEEIRFLFSADRSGYSAKVEYLVDGSSAYVGRNMKDQSDVEELDMELSVDTKSPYAPGETVAVVLNCRPE